MENHNLTTFEIEKQIHDYMNDNGVYPPDKLILDGKLHRFSTSLKRNDLAGWYCFHIDGIPAGIFGDWRIGQETIWVANIGRSLTFQEQEINKQRIKAASEERQKERMIDAEKARVSASSLVSRANDASCNHPYLVAKKVAPHGIKQWKNMLVIPMYDIDGILHNVQYIFWSDDEKKFEKRFKKGGRKSGCFFPIGDLNNPKIIYVCEGFATGVSINEATGMLVIVAFDSGNLLPVVQAVRGKYVDVRIVVCADDDWKSVANVGVIKATKAAEAVGGSVVVPRFPDESRGEKDTDFNDLELLCGREAVKQQIERTPNVDMADGMVDNVVPLVQPGKRKRGRPAKVKVVGGGGTGGGDGGGNNNSTGGGGDNEENGKESADTIALVIAETSKEILKYVNKWGKWFVWDEKVWQEEETLWAFDFCRDYCRRYNNVLPPLVAGVEKFVKADRRIATKADIWDTNLMMLNTPGGIIDLNTGELLPHDSKMFCRLITNATPNKDCETPLWDAMLKQATLDDDDYIEYLYKIFGYCLTGLTKEQQLWFMYGRGGNSKGTILKTIASIIGTYAKVADSTMFMQSMFEQHPTNLAKLAGARLVISQEINQGAKWDQRKINSITGGDDITARFMRQDEFTYTPQFKLIIAGNNRPELDVIDDATKRRFRILPFTYRIPENEKDKDLFDKMKIEWPGILYKLVDGCLRWQRDGLKMPKRVKDVTDEYFVSENNVELFIKECCDVNVKPWLIDSNNMQYSIDDDGEKIYIYRELLRYLYAAFSLWCWKNKNKDIGSKKFSDDLELLGYEKTWPNNKVVFKGLMLNKFGMSSISTNYSSNPKDRQPWDAQNPLKRARAEQDFYDG